MNIVPAYDHLLVPGNQHSWSYYRLGDVLAISGELNGRKNQLFHIFLCVYAGSSEGLEIVFAR